MGSCMHNGTSDYEMDDRPQEILTAYFCAQSTTYHPTNHGNNTDTVTDTVTDTTGFSKKVMTDLEQGAPGKQ